MLRLPAMWIVLGVAFALAITRFATAENELEIRESEEVTASDRDYWAFRPLHSPAVPRTRVQGPCRTPIDALVLRRLEAAGLDFSPEADRRTLIRRASFDLIGLPPSPDDVAAFLADDRSDAFERLVDRLLDSYHFGENGGGATGWTWRDTSTSSGRMRTPRPFARRRTSGSIAIT